jgi:flagellar L-ring protein precursor FlgH
MTVLLTVQSAAIADSIWAKKNMNMKSSYSDDVARKIGDILTITIYENSNASSSAERDMSKVTSRDQQFDGNIGIEGVITNIPAVDFGAGTSYQNNFASNTDNSNQRSFQDNITVVVVDIMPNGNLVVSGTCTRNISDDIQEVQVSGIIRPSDIAYNNTVDSKFIANFNIVANYKGVEAPYNKPGWLGRILDALWPF